MVERTSRRNRSRTTRPQGDNSGYTDKPKRQAAHIEAGYEKKGAGMKTPEARACATVNTFFGGGKQGGPGRKSP